MADVAPVEDYLAQIQALLPEGRAWPRDPDATVTRLLAAVAGGFARLDTHAGGLLDDVRPGAGVHHLTDWERVLGLPDACATSPGSLRERRGRVVEKMTSVARTVPERYVAIAAALGYEAEVIEHDQTAATALSGLDTAGGKWRYVWWLRVDTEGRTRYLDALSSAADPLRSAQSDAEVECRVRAAAPAHTHPAFTWAGRSLVIAGNNPTGAATSLYTVDPVSGAATLHVALNRALPYRGGSAVHNGKILFRVVRGGLSSIDFETGRVASISNDVGTNDYHQGLASHRGELLGIVRERTETGSRLIEISPTNGTFETRAEAPIDVTGGLASIDGSLYATTESSLYVVDPVSGAARRVGALGRRVFDCAMSFHRRGLFVASRIRSGDYELLSVNPATGEATRIAGWSDYHSTPLIVSWPH